MCQISLIAFAFVLLAKIILNCRIQHYGFVLAMPAVLILVVMLLQWIPSIIRRFGGQGEIFSIAAMAWLLVCIGAFLHQQSIYIGRKAYPVGVGSDSFHSDIKAAYVNAVLEELIRRSKPDETVAVLPGGITINYLARRRIPTPYTNCYPSRFFFFGDEKVTAAFKTHTPDWIVWIRRDLQMEFGVRFFGKDYAQELGHWIDQDYQTVAHWGGDPPFVRLLEWKHRQR